MGDENLLQQVLDVNDIDLGALERLRNRLFVVGRFNNQQSRDADPDLYLFTNRPEKELSDRYKLNFKSVLPLEYNHFVKALRPAIAERVERDGRFPVVHQIVPQGDDALDGTCVIDTFNFFFQRAIANPAQDVFKDGEPALPKELLQDSGREGGKAIFQLIRRNLHQFSEFQPRTHEIVLAISKLLSICGMENGMPSYGNQGALPRGFPGQLVDFLYAQDASENFTTEGLDFEVGDWKVLRNSKDKRSMFCNVVEAFRDELLGAKHQQFNGISFGGKTLNEQAHSVLDKDLIREFGKARDAFNGLRQVLRSKVLLSMVLEWLLKAYYDIDAVKELEAKGIVDGTSHDEAIENAILHDWKANGLAQPIKRPSLEDRRTFSRELTNNFELLLKAVLTGDEVALAGLPSEVRRLAEEARKNQDLVKILTGVTGKDLGDDYQQAFTEAAKIILLDVLCPTLFQIPILSEHMLRQYFRRETMAAYLTAVFLDDQSQDAVRRIAEDHIKYFQEKIDEETQQIRDVGEIQERLLHRFLDVLAKPEMGRRLREGLRVLVEAHTVLENARFDSAANREPGAGKISAICPDPKYKPLVKVFDRTPARDEDVTKPIENVVGAEVKRQIEKIVEKVGAQAASKADASVSGTPTSKEPHVDGLSMSSGLGAGQAAGAKDLPSETADNQAPVVSEIEKSAKEAVQRVLSKAFGNTPPAKIGPTMEADLARDASKDLLGQPKFIETVKGNVRAFEQALFLIYQRYNENKEKTTFRNRVERLTLINMMMLFQKELGLGQVSSNLHHLLLDLVQHMDPDKPDPRAFLREKSLTVYFDNADIDNGGFTALVQTLRAQGFANLEQTKDFVSELRGVKYLMDVVAESGDPRAEIVVVNATAREFLDWLQKENLRTTVGSQARLRSGNLVKTGSESQSLVLPGLVYLTDVAFGGGSGGAAKKLQFISGLANAQLAERQLSMILPPLCISTSYRKGDEGWIGEGKRMADAASGAPAPVLIVGPTAYMNQHADAFKTYLSAGYLFAAHFLRASLRGVQNQGINDTSSGRFRVVGYGAAPMDECLERLTWGMDGDSYAFAADFYLYVILTILATAHRRVQGGTDVHDIYKCLYYDEYAKDPHKSSAILDPVLIGGAQQFATNEDLAAVPDLV